MIALTARERVQDFLEGRDPRWGRLPAFVIQGLIAVSALSVAVSTVPGLPGWVHTTLFWQEAVIALLFAAEYLARLWSAPVRWRYAFGFWGIVDLAAVLPSLLALGTDALVLRTLRMLRLVRLLKLARYTIALDRLAGALGRVRAELTVFLILTLILLYIAAAGIYLFEHEAQPEAFASIPHSFWWAVATLTTVGYGDVYPVTLGGRLFTIFVLMLGLGIVAVPTGLIATALAQEVRGPSPGPDPD